MNIAELSPENSDEFTLTVGQEPFIYKEFWRDWHVLVYALVLILCVLAPKHFIDFYTLKRLKLVDKRSIKKGFTGKIRYLFELLDLFKDQVYLYTMKHKTGPLLFLCNSIAAPFALLDAAINEESMPDLNRPEPIKQTIMHNFMIYLGFTDGSLYEEGVHANLAPLVIGLGENVSQFTVITIEMFSLRTSVTFLQAANSLFALTMVYKGIAVTIASAIYDVALDWESKHIVIKLLIPVVLSFPFLPQIIVSSCIYRNMWKEGEVPAILFDEGLLLREDP